MLEKILYRKPYLVPQLQEYQEHCKHHALIREVTFANHNLSPSARGRVLST